MKYLGQIVDDYDLVNKKYVDDAVAGGGGGGGSGTVTSVAVDNASNGGLTISGSPVTTSGTISIGHTNVLTNAQTTQALYPIKIDKNGHISEYGTAVTVPSAGTSASAVGTTASGGSATTWSKSDHIHSISSSTITTALGYTPSSTDEKLGCGSTSTGTTYSAIVGIDAAASTRSLARGLKYADGSGSGAAAVLTLGTSTASAVPGNMSSIIRLYGTSSGYTDLKPTYNSTGSINISLPATAGTLALKFTSTTDIANFNTSGATFTPTKDGIATFVARNNGSNSASFSVLSGSNRYVALVTQAAASGYLSACFPVVSGTTYTLTLSNLTSIVASVTYFG